MKASPAPGTRSTCRPLRGGLAFGATHSGTERLPRNSRVEGAAPQERFSRLESRSHHGVKDAMPLARCRAPIRCEDCPRCLRRAQEIEQLKEESEKQMGLTRPDPAPLLSLGRQRTTSGTADDRCRACKHPRRRRYRAALSGLPGNRSTFFLGKAPYSRRYQTAGSKRAA